MRKLGSKKDWKVFMVRDRYAYFFFSQLFLHNDKRHGLASEVHLVVIGASGGGKLKLLFGAWKLRALTQWGKPRETELFLRSLQVISVINPLE